MIRNILGSTPSNRPLTSAAARTCSPVAVAVMLVVSALRPAPVPAKKSNADALSRINHLVVIYEENHSFDNLYGGWEGVDGLDRADFRHTVQVDQRGLPWSCLAQNDVNLASPALAATCTDRTSAMSFGSHFPNTPFVVDTFIAPAAKTCPRPGTAARQWRARRRR